MEQLKNFVDKHPYLTAYLAVGLVHTAYDLWKNQYCLTRQNVIESGFLTITWPAADLQELKERYC